jgi:hypothetical protein
MPRPPRTSVDGSGTDAGVTVAVGPPLVIGGYTVPVVAPSGSMVIAAAAGPFE